MKTFFYDFGKGVDAMTDRRMMPPGFVVVADNVDLRTGYPRPFQAPVVYQTAIPPTTTRAWEFQGKWFYSALYRTYAAEALPTQQRIYWAEEGPGHGIPQKVVNGVQAQLGLFVPLAAPQISSGVSISPTSLTATATTGGSLPANTQFSYRVSANTALGTLPACGGMLATTSTTNNAVQLTWNAVSGAINYTVFGRSAGKEQIISSAWGSTNYLDTGSVSPSGAYASSFDVNAALQYVYTYVRTVGSMQDESGPSPIATEINTGFGRLITRLPALDGFFSGGTTYTATLSTAGNQFYQTITGVLSTASGSTITLSAAPTGPWYNTFLLHLLSGGVPGTGQDVTPSGVGTSWSYPTALANPTAPVAGTPTSGGTLGAGTYNWVVTAIQGARGTNMTPTGVPAQTLPSSQSSPVTLASANIVPLSWTPVLNATGYRLYRTANGGSTWTLIAELASTISTYQDDGTNITVGISLPTANTTATQCILLPFDATSLLPSINTTTTTYYAAMQAALVSLPAAQVVANGDAVLFAGSATSAFNTQYAATLPTVVAMSNANVNISNPASSTFDGFNVQTTQVVLLTGQSTASQNGPWIFNGTGHAMTRPTWYASGEVLSSTNPMPSIYITNGTTFGKTYQSISTAYPITIDTTATTWASTTTTFSFLINAFLGGTTTASSMTWITGNNNITGWRLYRTGDTTSFLKVADIPLSQVSYEDMVPVTALGSSLPTSYTDNGVVVTYKPPPKTLRYLELFNGMLFGVDGNTVRWTPIGVHDAWPDSFTVNMSYPPTGLAAYASGLIILCPDAIYRLDGFDPTQLSLQRTYAEDGCVAPRSIQKTAQGLMYVAKRGLMLFNGTTAICLTEGKLPAKFLLNPSTYTGGYSAQNFWWYTTDHTQAYAALSWSDNAAIYSQNVISPTITDDMPPDGPVDAIRSFVYRNRYYAYYSSTNTNYAANTMVCVDLGAPGYPISTLGAKLIDAHVSSLDEAYVLVGNDAPQMTVTVTAPSSMSVVPVNVAIAYSATAVTGTAGGSYDGPYTFAWAFDDTGTSTGATTTHTWTTAGVHLATATGTNTTTHQTASASQSVRAVSQWTTDAATLPFTSGGLSDGPYVFPNISGTTATIINLDYAAVNGLKTFIYDQVNHTVTSAATAPAGLGQDGFNICQLADGRILRSGGFSGASNSTPVKTAAIYDPIANTWTSVASRNNQPNSNAGIYSDVLLPSGKVFSATANNGSLSNEIYDPVANTWTTLPAMPGNTSFNNPAVCLVGSGKVMRGCGHADASFNAYIYDPSSNTWSTAATNSSWTTGGVTCLVGLLNGKVLSINANNVGTNNCQLYDPTTNTWSATGNPASGLDASARAYLQSNGTVLLLNGATKAAYVYYPSSGTWATLPSTNAVHNRITPTVLGSGVAVVAGTFNPGSSSVEYLS